MIQELHRLDIFGIIEEQAIEFFGKDKIGTKELREKLSQEEKQAVLDFCMQQINKRYQQQGFIHVEFI